jgi:hypothetical protein
VSSLSGNPLQSVVADPGTCLNCLVTETRRLVDRQALTSAEAIFDFLQDRADRVGNLIHSRSCARGGASASTVSNSAEFIFNGA